MHRAILTALAGFVTLVAASATQGEPDRLTRLATSDQGRGWEAVGRLETGQGSFCTGTLIAPDLVLTAAHCLYHAESGEPVALADIEFRAAWRNGRAEAYRGARRAVAHPEYRYEGRDGLDRVAFDIALVQLDRPIRTLRVSPFATTKAPARRDAVGVVSYAQDRSEAPSYEGNCEVIDRRLGIVTFSCSVDFGSSGAPVFVIGPDGPQVASVVSAKAMLRGRPVALGTALGGELDRLRAALAGSGGGVMNRGGNVQFLSGSESRERGRLGARFVKP